MIAGTLTPGSRVAGPSKTWVVRGRRSTPDGGTEMCLATAWGHDEAGARRGYAALQAKSLPPLSGERRRAWADDELTFTPVEEARL